MDIHWFYAGLCLIYGSDPEQYHTIADEGGLSEDRLDLCTEEIPRKRYAWRQLLKPYIRSESSLL